MTDMSRKDSKIFNNSKSSAPTDYELSKIADTLDEDALQAADFELLELVQDSAASFKKRYFDLYDDIKQTPRDDW